MTEGITDHLLPSGLPLSALRRAAEFDRYCDGANLGFIRNAKDVLALLDELARLSEDNQRLTNYIEKCGEAAAGATSERRRLTEVIEQIRALHQPGPEQNCQQCADTSWPCPTAALDDDEKRALTDAVAERNSEGLHLRVQPGMRFGAPHIRGRAAEFVAGPIAGGDSVDTTAEDYDLTRTEVLLCCWFMALYGAKLADEPNWDQWRPWHDQHYNAMARGRWGEIPDPPPWTPVGEEQRDG